MTNGEDLDESEKVNSAKSADETSVKISNSYKLKNPVVIKAYSFYLNYINDDTKDVIKGTTIDFYYELMVYNLVYNYGNIVNNNEIKAKASDLDAGITIFNDEHGFKGSLMKIAYFISFPIPATIDYIIYGVN